MCLLVTNWMKYLRWLTKLQFLEGNKIGDFNSEELDEKSLSYYMTGREIEYPRYHRTCEDNTPILEVEGLTRTGQYSDISLKVRPGDIIGLTGLLGSGRTETCHVTFRTEQTTGR